MPAWLIDAEGQRAYQWPMALFAVWVGLGALVGSLVGIHRCSDVRRNLPTADHALHVGFCAGVGGLAGFLLFAILAIVYYGPLAL